MVGKGTIFILLICLFVCSICIFNIIYDNEVSSKFFQEYAIVKNTKSGEYVKKFPNKLISNDFKIWKPKGFDINCARVINNDIKYIDKLKNNRFIMKSMPKSYEYDCKSIKSRGFYPKMPLSEIEANYPIAYARNVYSDYHILELQFLLSYAPQNHYCFAVDSKSTQLYEQLTSLAKCFDNVYISPKQYNMNSGGIYQALNTYECMKILLNKKWNYLFTLQNDDFPIKTNREIVEILTARNSTLDMEFCNPRPFVQARVDHSKSWDYSHLNFFNESITKQYDSNLLNQKMEFSKGSYASGIPYDSVNFIINKINITTYLNQINTANKYGEDEMVWQTLFSDSFLKIPHYVDRNCLSTLYNNDIFMVRNVKWPDNNCTSNIWHHNVCVYGIEMLDEIRNMKSHFGYRFISKIDFGAALCFTEYLFNKTYINIFNKYDVDFYINLPSTKYQNANAENKKEILKNCTLSKKW